MHEEYFHIKRGATAPALLVVFEPATADFSQVIGATLRVKRTFGDQALIIQDEPMSLGSLVINGVSRRTATYAWPVGKTDIEGKYLAQVTLNYPDGSDEPLPTLSFLNILIGPAL